MTQKRLLTLDQRLSAITSPDLADPDAAAVQVNVAGLQKRVNDAIELSDSKAQTIESQLNLCEQLIAEDRDFKRE